MPFVSAHSVRIVALTEAVSFLLLLFVAMPLKYLAGLPQAVFWIGLIHGILFVALGALLFGMLVTRRWRLGRVFLVFIAALLPFGPFIIDGRLKDYEHAL